MKALVLDFDGVVADTETLWFRAVAGVFDEHGGVLDERAWAELAVGRTHDPDWRSVLVAQVGEGAAVPDWPELRLRVRADYDRLASHGLRPRHGVVGLLDAAAAAGVPVAIASNSPRDWLDRHLALLGLGDRFAAMWSIDRVRHGKPHPELYERAVASLGVAPADAVAVEDSPPGVEAAKAAGLAVVAAPLGPTVGMAFPGADLVVGTLADLTVGLLRSLVAG